MQNKLLNFISNLNKPNKKRKRINRQKLAKKISRTNTPFGKIAKEKLRRDKMLKEIMRGM